MDFISWLKKENRWEWSITVNYNYTSLGVKWLDSLMAWLFGMVSWLSNNQAIFIILSWLLNFYACAFGVLKLIGGIEGWSGSLIGPFCASNLLTLSFRAFNKRLACCGVKITRVLTLAFGTFGRIRTKSTTNSELEWEIIAKLE